MGTPSPDRRWPTLLLRAVFLAISQFSKKFSTTTARFGVLPQRAFQNIHVLEVCSFFESRGSKQAH